MNLPQLYYFRKLAQVLHYTKAANELFITQPALSDSIASLESELGLPLFQKTGRKIQLTKYGIEFNQYVCSTLNELERGIAVMKEQAGGVGGVIDVGCIPTLLGDYLPETIDNYKSAKNPSVKFNIYEGMSLSIIDGVKSGKYDLGFCSKVENEPDLFFVPALFQEIIIIANKSHPLAKHQELSLEDLKGYEIYTYRLSIPIGITMQMLLDKHKLKGVYEYDDEISIGGMVSRSKSPIAAIVADTTLLKQFDKIVRIKLLDVPINTRVVYMVFCRKAQISQAAKSFIDYVAVHECVPLSTIHVLN